jgi:hypothetical protein
MGTVNYGEILHASHTPKIIVTPCAGKRHAGLKGDAMETGHHR